MALAALLLWLSGACLRVTVLAVPPLLPAIHRDLHLNETGIGLLTSLPSLMFAWAAIPGSLLIARYGAVRTLLAGLLAAAIASALRGAAADALALYAATLVMAMGLSVMQPSLPLLVHGWMPGRIGFGTAVYSNGWLVGEILAVWLTIPYLLPLVGGSWRLSLVAWSLPVMATAVLVVIFAPGRASPQTLRPAGVARWWPSWRDSRMWRLAFIMGSANVAYWTTNGFLPDFLTHIGRPELISGALTALNLGQLPISLLLLFLAERMAGRAWPLFAAGLLMLAGLFAMVVSPNGFWIVLGAGAVGFACAWTLIAGLTLPPMLYQPEDVSRTVAGMFTVSYSCSVAVPIVGGLLWDATGSPYFVFILIALGGVAILGLPWTLHRRA